MSYGTNEDFLWATELTTKRTNQSEDNLAPPEIVIDGSSTESHFTSSSARTYRDSRCTHTLSEDVIDFESTCVHIARNSIEAHRVENNYKFGMKIWKNHLTSPPIDQRSEEIQELYSDIDKVTDHKASTLRPSNFIYTILFGWWLCLLYGFVGVLMAMTYIGLPHAKVCWRLALYFLWPFGKFVSQVRRCVYDAETDLNVGGSDLQMDDNVEGDSLIESVPEKRVPKIVKRKRYQGFWSRSSSWVWIILGLPILLVAHSVVFIVCWLFIVSIPTAKLNGKMLTKVLYLPPSEIEVGDSADTFEDGNNHQRKIIMYTHQSINIYFFRYTLDGVNIIMVNLLFFVIVAIVLGFASDISPLWKAIVGVLAIIPLTYYIGQAIASLSAQSTFFVGALLNATFGSAVEVILCILLLKKGVQEDDDSYQEIVKSALAGAFFMGILFIPGLSMVIGGLKYRTQKFNPKSANITASYLFLTVVGVFAPTMFFKIYGITKCHGCQMIDGDFQQNALSHGIPHPNSSSIICHLCQNSLTDYQGDRDVYNNHIKPLVYAICIVLPLSYTIGIIFTLKSHSQIIFADFERELRQEIGDSAFSEDGAHWSRSKCTIILFFCAVATALCGEIISDNLQPLLKATGMSEYFVGVSLLALVAGLPECVNGVQFALHNNVNLGIEVGCATAIQVGMVQIPALVLTNLIYNLDFHLVFNEVHLWAVLFSVVIINYIFQDGKSDYFQGTVVVSLHFLLMLMYYFMLTPDELKSEDVSDSMTTAVPTTVASVTGSSSQNFFYPV